MLRRDVDLLLLGLDVDLQVGKKTLNPKPHVDPKYPAIMVVMSAFQIWELQFKIVFVVPDWLHLEYQTTPGCAAHRSEISLSSCPSMCNVALFLESAYGLITTWPSISVLLAYQE
jgi:hypothetical protein